LNLCVNFCGIEFKTPLIAASGTFGYGREMQEYMDLCELGGISSKAVTGAPRLGNPSPRIAETASGCLNAVGLQNPGIDAFLATELPFMQTLGTRILVNVSGSTEEEYLTVIEKLRGKGIDMVELNISCPNVKMGAMSFGTSEESAFEITKKCKSVCDVPLMVKLTPNVCDIASIAVVAQEAGADAISLINTITGMAVDAITRRPILANVTGGLSGPAIKPVALRMVYQVAKAVHIPVVGLGGIMTGTDVAEFMLCGARAVMIGTANLITPTAMARIKAELLAFMAEQRIDDVNELVGSLRV
jgi:dihydroorotate dehydrogenase (NAD+) catalytic subunit